MSASASITTVVNNAASTLTPPTPPTPLTPPTTPTPPARVRPPSLQNTDRAIEKFIELRDKIAALKKRHTAELAPFNQAKDLIEAWLLSDLNAANVEAMRASTGTVYKSVRTSATVSEWSKTLEYIQANDAWELLTASVSKVAAEAIINETQAPIPGVSITREIILNVRKPT